MVCSNFQTSSTSEQSGRLNRGWSIFYSAIIAHHTTTNRTPSSLLLKRELRTRLDLGEKQAAQKLSHDSYAKQREYKIGDNVMARNYGSGPKWESAIVVERKGPLSYTVQLNSGVIWRRHIINFAMECQTPHRMWKTFW